MYLLLAKNITERDIILDYRLNLGAWRKIFAVPMCVAEDHLKIASGTQIKVLLYMLAHSDLGLRADIIAEAVGVRTEDADDALLYWVNAGVLSNSGTEYYPSGNEMTCAAPQPAAPAVPAGQELDSPKARALLGSETQCSAEAVAAAIRGDDAVKCLFEMYEKLAGRPLQHSERQTLMVMVEEVGLPCEVTMMLVEYCFDIGKATPAYMKTVALNWVENDITDISRAEEHIRKLRTCYTLENELRRRFGLSTSFSSKQRGTIEEWAAMGIGSELIGAAYDECMDNTGKLSFPYIDKVLRSWLSKGVTDPSQLADLPKPSSGGSVGGSAPSYNIDEAEQRARNKYKNL